MRQVKAGCKFCILLFLGLSLALLFGALTPTKWSNLNQCDDTIPIYVVSDVFHSNFLVPVQNEVYDWKTSELANTTIKSAAKSSSYLLIGWGDQDFYMHWADGTAQNAWSIFKAAFLPTKTVMHIGVFPQPIKPSENLSVKRIWITPENYKNLIGFIESGFQLDSQEKWIYRGKGLERKSAFFTGTGFYSALYSCNSWIAEGLRLADINTPLWPGLAPVLMHHLPTNSCERTAESAG